MQKAKVIACWDTALKLANRLHQLMIWSSISSPSCLRHVDYILFEGTAATNYMFI